MSVILARDFFFAAPMFQDHEGLVGARYHKKDPNDPNAPGLWIVEEPETLEIAEQTGFSYSTLSRDKARQDYWFTNVKVQPGDAVIDYHLSFQGSRAGYNRSIPDIGPNSGVDMYAAERANGALIQFHIPKDRFRSEYAYDDGRQEYRRKPFPMKFTSQETFVRTEDGNVEHIPKYCEVSFQDRILRFNKPGIFSGYAERLICGQPLSFYVRELGERLSESTFGLEIASFSTGLSYSHRAGKKPQNPYTSLKSLFASSAKLFSQHAFLTEDQSAELQAHVNDIQARFDYFEQKPFLD